MGKSFNRGMLILLLVFMTCTSCIATQKKNVKRMLHAQKEMACGNAVKDSIADIIVNSKCIVAQLQAQAAGDSVRTDSVCKVPKDMKTVLKYLFLDERNFQKNDVVYGPFTSWISYTFSICKHRTMVLEMDFGLRKWRLLDAEKKVVCCYDMTQTNLEMLRFSRMLFPKDSSLKLIEENYKAAEK